MPNGCIEWKGAYTKSRYPTMNVDGKTTRLSRLSYMWGNGLRALSTDQYVCHTCDNRNCVNPDHLWLGTASDNSMDCLRKGRHGNARLTEVQVAYIKRLLEARVPYEEISECYGVTFAAISFIAHEKSWAYVQPYQFINQSKQEMKDNG